MRFIPQLPVHGSDNKKKNTASAAFMKAHKKGAAKAQQSAEERYDEIFKSKMEEVRNEALKGAKYNFNLPGTDNAECRQLSKGAQEIIQKVAEKKAKQAEKRAKKADIVAVQAKYFIGQQGGRIDKQGRIFDANNQEVMKVDKKTGKIKNKWGNTVGKYDPTSPMSEHKICQLIDKYSKQPQGMSGLWGGSGGNKGGGSVWGSGGGTVWGNNDDSGNNGWW